MHTMHLLPSVAIQPNLELRTRPKQLLGSLPLVIVLPGQVQGTKHSSLFCRRVSGDEKKVFHLDDVDGPVGRQQDPVVDGDGFETGDGLAKPVPDESEQLLEGYSG